jgi:SAM-dependent methyltransferase
MPVASIRTIGAKYSSAVALLVSLLLVPHHLARSQETAVAPESPPNAATELPNSVDPPLRTYMGRTIAPFMDASGADWLVRNTRNREEHPAKLLKALGVAKGEAVCDFGCGNGFYTLQLAQRVGPRGKVFAVDIQQEMLDQLRERMGARGLHNVELILCTETDPRLPAGQVDIVLMVDVYHELSHPPEVLRSVRASLRPEGRLVLVEFREEDPTVPIKPLHKMSQAQVNREISANGFKLVEQFDGLPWQHVLFFARDDSPRKASDLRPWTGPFYGGDPGSGGADRADSSR